MKAKKAKRNREAERNNLIHMRSQHSEAVRELSRAWDLFDQLERLMARAETEEKRKEAKQALKEIADRIGALQKLVGDLYDDIHTLNAQVRA